MLSFLSIQFESLLPDQNSYIVKAYLNYLKTERVVFLPVFGIEQDAEAETFARQLFSKEIVPVNIRKIAQQGGCLNCISWEGPHA